MSILYHPSLTRFVSAEEAASATDSDSYYGAGQRRAGPDRTRRDRLLVGKPGSRRHQRHLNNTFAEYESEYDTASDWDSDEDRPIVRFEWRQDFVAVGNNFFEQRPGGMADQVVGARTRDSNKLTRRGPRMARRKAGAAPVEAQQEEEEEEGAVEEHHAQARRERAAAKAASAAGTTDSEHEKSSAAPSRSHRRRRRLAGQSAAGALFSTIDSNLRHALRRLSPEGHEQRFLVELEELLINFKNGRAHQPRRRRRSNGADSQSGVPPSVLPVPSVGLFDILQSERLSPRQADVAAADDDDDDTEVTSADDDMVLVDHKAPKAPHKSSRRDRPQGDEPVQINFRTARERFLAHGMAQFHQLVCESHDAPPMSIAQHRISEIRLPRAGVLLHDARLMPYLAKCQACSGSMLQ